MAKYSKAQEEELMLDIFALKNQPEKFVRYCYPWGEHGTPLEHKTGPSTWQMDLFMDITEKLLWNEAQRKDKKDASLIREAIASGHGIGKSSTMAWLSHWFESTRPGATTIVTANTEDQLRGKTWPELGKWVNMALNEHWFEVTATKMLPSKWFGGLVSRQLYIDIKYYYAAAVTWNEDKPESFAGIHSQYGTNFIFDEASTIPSPIWETTLGAMTDEDGDKIWAAFGNPTQNSGPFFECFHKNRRLWKNRNIDSRTVEITNKTYLNEIIEEYGEDSDVSRVRVKGQFPRQGTNQFISGEVVSEAQIRQVEEDRGAPLIMGIDVARFGDDESVFFFRKGRDARSIPVMNYMHMSVLELANEAAKMINEYKPDGIFIDEGGVGGGLVDILLGRGFKVVGINFGSKAKDKNKHLNMRCQMWDDMKDWLSRGAISDDEILYSDLTSPMYKYTGDASTLSLEKKDEMKKRGLSSPDWADGLALTFAAPVSRRDFGPYDINRGVKIVDGIDYDVFA